MASPARTLVFAIALAAISSAGSAQAPVGNGATRYYMRVEAATGSRIGAVRCWTRQQWEEQGVDLDKDWPFEGVRTVEPVAQP